MRALYGHETMFRGIRLVWSTTFCPLLNSVYHSKLKLQINWETEGDDGSGGGWKCAYPENARRRGSITVRLASNLTAR